MRLSSMANAGNHPRIRVGAAALAVLSIVVTPLSDVAAQTPNPNFWIGVFSTQTHQANERCVTVDPFVFVQLYVYYIHVTGTGIPITGAEYKITGLPGTKDVDYVVTLINAPGSNLNLGNAFDGTGHIVAWPSNQMSQNDGILLATYSLLVTNAALIPPTGAILEVTNRTPPTNVLFPCPLLVKADFTLECVMPLQSAVNNAEFCITAVNEQTWSEVRNLYR